MYVSVPKNYSGIAFSHGSPVKRDVPPHPAPSPSSSAPPSPPPSPPPRPEEKAPCLPSKEEMHTPCEGCKQQEKNPLTCLLTALRDRGKAGFDTEDFLLIGLIVLLLGKEGNEDTVLILAMLLLL